jgi:hypothetical protein
MTSRRLNNLVKQRNEVCSLMLPSNWFSRKNLYLAVCMFGCLVVAGGCGKKSPSAAAPPPPDAAALSAASNQPASPQAGQPPPALVQADGQPDLAELNRTLIRWIVRNRRPPANFGDFAGTAGVAIPPPPSGKKYFIAKNMKIQLVNQ